MGIDRDTGANTPVPRPTFAMPLLPMTCITALTAKKARQIRPRLFVGGKFGTGPAWAECRNAAEEHDERFGGLGWPRPDSPTLPRISRENVLTAACPSAAPQKKREPSFKFLLRRIILRRRLGARANVD
jgi:hypothetical protein